MFDMFIRPFDIVCMIVEPELLLPLAAAAAPIPNVRLQTYTTIPGIKTSSVVFRDNIGFMYYKNRTRANKM